ncbi:hypothetical protein FBQ97_04315 [Acidobacteria bacterium ACD]|nr:MAG: hypothetical protein EDX89_08725 [Acidobacteriota bacterium]MDL1949022.1 hypothetical protein [Acidobacteria bacterium ACD]
MPTPGSLRRLAPGALGLAALAGAAFLALGMGRGLLLSADVLTWVWPWGGLSPRAELQAPALSDPVWQFVPWWEFARRELLAGRFPLWNPHQDAGVPLAGNPLPALGSPLVWPILLLGVERGLNLTLLLKVLTAAGSAFAWLRGEGRSPAASWLGGVAFGLSGAFVGWLEHPHTLSALPVPLLLLFARRLVERYRPADVLGLAAATYLVLAGGHPETWLMALLVAGAWVLFHARSAGSVGRPLLGALLGGAVAAPLVLPFVEYYLLSAARMGADRHTAVLPLAGLLRLVVPDAAVSHPVEGAATVSVTVLVLALGGAAAGWRDRRCRFWAAVLLLLLAASFDGPLARGLARATPVYWSRLLLLLPLPAGWLASWALDRISGKLPRARPALLALPAVAAAELLAAARGVHAVVPAGSVFPDAPILERLAAEPGPTRVLPLHSFLPANSATALGLDDLRGYDALGPRDFRARRQAVGRFRTLPVTTDAIEPWDLAPGGAALDEWSVTHLALHPQFAFSAATLNERLGLDLEEVYAGPDGKLLRNRRARPRVRLEPAGEARIARRAPGLWVVETRAESPSSLVVADAAWPGWRATVNGAPAPVASPVGAPFRVAVPAGIARVVLRYECPPLRAGLALAAAALGVLGGLLLAGTRKRAPSSNGA